MSNLGHIWRPVWLMPVCVFLLVLAGTLAMWHFQTRREQEQIRRETHLAADVLAGNLKSSLDTQVKALSRMADRWQAMGGTPRSVWEQDARNHIRDLQSFQAIEWADSSPRIRWVVPMEGNEKALNLYLFFEERRRIALENARENNQPTMSRTIDLVQGGKGFLVYIPVYANGESDGFIVGVFKVEDFLNRVLRETALSGYSVRVLDGNTEVYFAGEPQADFGMVEATVQTMEMTWRMHVWPTPSIIEARYSVLPKVTLGGGIALAGMAFCIAFLLGHTRRSEHRLRQAREELIQANEALHVAIERAEAANIAKSEFLANMSHEIRTPMNGVLGMTELVLETDLNDDQKGLLQDVYMSAEALLHIINDILDFSKNEAGMLALDPQPFELRETLLGVVRTLKLQAQEKSLELKYAMDDAVPNALRGDVTRLRQVLVNLTGNAIKFTEVGQVNIQVTLVRLTEHEANIRFEVQDTGIGIPLDRQAQVFDAFSQADGSVSRKYGGTGLGLAISQQLVALMGGNIQLESEPNKGSTFYFTLPFVLANDLEEGDISPESIHPLRSGLSILLAEDNRVNQRLASRILSKQGHQVVIAESGEEAVQFFFEGSFDLVLMDVQLPGMDGLEATRNIRKIETEKHLKRIPIVALTANILEEDRRKCREAGMDAFVGKPISQEELMREINLAFDTEKE